MHKKFLALLLGVLILLAGLVACRVEDTKNTTSTTASKETIIPGLNTTPSGFVGFGDSTKPSGDATAPTQIATEPTQGQTEPSATEPTESPIRPSEDPTLPSEDPTEPSADPQFSADAESYAAFLAMSPAEKYAFFKQFNGSNEAFNAWFNAALAAYQEVHPDYVYNGGQIVLPE